MVTLELPQARRLAMSVVLGQVVVTVVAALLCFAVWGPVAGYSALAGGGISATASAQRRVCRRGAIGRPWCHKNNACRFEVFRLTT